MISAGHCATMKDFTGFTNPHSHSRSVTLTLMEGFTAHDSNRGNVRNTAPPSGCSQEPQIGSPLGSACVQDLVVQQEVPQLVAVTSVVNQRLPASKWSSVDAKVGKHFHTLTRSQLSSLVSKYGGGSYEFVVRAKMPMADKNSSPNSDCDCGPNNSLCTAAEGDNMGFSPDKQNCMYANKAFRTATEIRQPVVISTQGRSSDGLIVDIFPNFEKLRYAKFPECAAEGDWQTDKRDYAAGRPFNS